VKNTKDIIVRYSIATLGLLLVAIGVALSIKSNLGTSPFSSIPYVCGLKGGLSVGGYTILLNLTFLLIQLALLRKEFKAKYFLQIATMVLFGFMIDFSIWALGWLPENGIIVKASCLVLSVFFTALGMSLEIQANAWMLSGDFTVLTIAKAADKKTSTMKVIFDVALVVIAAALAWFFFRNPLGAGHFTNLWDSLLARTDDVVIGLGTIISALCTGLVMNLTDPIARKVMGKL